MGLPRPRPTPTSGPCPTVWIEFGLIDWEACAPSPSPEEAAAELQCDCGLPSPPLQSPPAQRDRGRRYAHNKDADSRETAQQQSEPELSLRPAPSITSRLEQLEDSPGASPDISGMK
uniref:Uncharacterized protein n=1 Tax=Knipowitschia caucasica TaxID=637954 RepID=A0AAV2J0U0_KNICA